MFHYPAFLLLMVLHQTGVNGLQFLNCAWVNSLNCVNFDHGIVCASNGQEYANRCYLVKAQCLDSKLRTVGMGTCSNNGYSVTATSTTDSTTMRASTSRKTTTATVSRPSTDLLHEKCDIISHAQCATDIEPICGSDGRTYINACEFRKDVCQRQDLTIKHLGFC